MATNFARLPELLRRPVIKEASARGLLAPEECAKPWIVIQACYAAQLSDAALDWLIRKEILTRASRAVMQELSSALSALGWSGALVFRARSRGCAGAAGKILGTTEV